MIDLKYFVGQSLVLVDPECEVFIFWNHSFTFNVVQRQIHSANYGRQAEYRNMKCFTAYPTNVQEAVKAARSWWFEYCVEGGPPDTADYTGL